MKRIIRIGFLVGLALGLVVFLFFGWTVIGSRVETGFHRAALAGLPRTASDISFYRRRDLTNVFAYEFRISRSDFEALAQGRGWPLRPSDRGVGITRFTNYLPKGHPERMKPFYVIATKWLFFEQVRPGDGCIYAMFEEASSKAYVYEGDQ
ncbi:MAG: hypothetical protein EXS39_07560 [Opitutaceae bacterium]|nr:hypothetical protein [Opitutaceae bacterium]